MIKLLSFLSLLLIIQPAYAQEEEKFDALAPKADLSELKHTKSGRIDKVIDGLTILLKDGTIVRLASIDIPDFHIWEFAPYAEASFKLLQDKLPERTEVMLYQTRNQKKGRVNRMNQELAHVVIKNDDVWLQGLYLANGLARVYTAPARTEMLDQMYKAEQAARKDKRGIWAKDSEYLILDPDTAQGHIGEFVIVEGVVKNAASVRNNIYLNFGKDWKTDFTVMVSPALRKKFSHQGISALSLSHTQIRVRGYLREYNGALIELEDTAHLEILEKPEILQKSAEQPNLLEQTSIKAKKINAPEQEPQQE